MSHIITRQMLGDQHPFAGRNWWYQFNSALTTFDEETIKQYVAGQNQKFAKLTKSWDDTLNTEWTCRIFYAQKMILAASVMLESLDYAKRKNLRVCTLYLEYYSLLYSLKALTLLLPEHKWLNGALIEYTHSKTINIASDEMARLSTKTCDRHKALMVEKQKILKLKAYREHISYRAPSSGGSMEKHNIDVIEICKVPVEMAQMLSELLECSIRKNVLPTYKPQLIDELLTSCYTATFEGVTFVDDEDHNRIDYLARKYPMPTNILHMMSEGHVEDFFGSWAPDKEVENENDSFNPDENWRILFDVP